MDRTSREIRRLLSAKGEILQVRFGRGSEMAIYAEGRFYSASMLLSLGDFAREESLLETLNSVGGTVLESSPKMRIGRKTVRALLLRFESKSQIVELLDTMRRWPWSRLRFAVGPGQVCWVGEVIPFSLTWIEEAKGKTGG